MRKKILYSKMAYIFILKINVKCHSANIYKCIFDTLLQSEKRDDRTLPSFREHKSFIQNTILVRDFEKQHTTVRQPLIFRYMNEIAAKNLRFRETVKKKDNIRLKSTMSYFCVL